MNEETKKKGKDPAVLFYTQDFIVGTMGMDYDQIGKYIILLCMQHQKGDLTETQMLKICSKKDTDVYAKFVKTPDGHYYNKRMKSEIEKRKEYSLSRSKNKLGKTKDRNHMIITSKSYDTTYDNHIENENAVYKGCPISVVDKSEIIDEKQLKDIEDFNVDLNSLKKEYEEEKKELYKKVEKEIKVSLSEEDRQNIRNYLASK